MSPAVRLKFPRYPRCLLALTVNFVLTTALTRRFVSWFNHRVFFFPRVDFPTIFTHSPCALNAVPVQTPSLMGRSAALTNMNNFRLQGVGGRERRESSVGGVSCVYVICAVLFYFIFNYVYPNAILDTQRLTAVLYNTHNRALTLLNTQFNKSVFSAWHNTHF